MTEQEELEEMINDMFESYLEGGFDFNSDMTFTEVFKQVFNDAVRMTMDILENAEIEDEEETA